MNAPLRRLVPARVRRSYAAKLVLALAVVVVVVCFIGGYIYLHTGAELTTDTQQDLVATAEVEAQTVDEWVERMRIQMLSLSDAAAFQSDDQVQVAVHLWEVVERDDDIEAAYYVDTETNQVMTSVGDARILSADGALAGGGRQGLTSIADRAGDDVTITQPFRPYPESEPVIVFATQVNGRSDRAIAVVVNLESLSRSKLHHSTSADVLVRNADGTVVLSENTSRILTTDPLQNETTVEGFVHVDSGGDAFAVGVASVESRGWVVTARESTSQAYALQSDISRQILGLLVVIVLGAVGIVLTFGRSNVNAVRELAAKAHTLQSGNLAVDVASDREDEFGTLYDAFDTMRVSLKRQIEEAESATAEARRARRESERLRDHLETKAEDYGETMAACAAGDLDRRLDPDSESAPMSSIAVAFNDMMTDVQSQNEQLATVTRVLSHDLRNPLNVASGQAEMLAERTGDEGATVVVEELGRMETILEDALVLARGDVKEQSSVDLGTVAREAWGHVETGRATLSVVDSRTFLADRTLLSQAFENLFRNAVEHGGRTSAVTVEATDGGFSVSDDGPGIPPAQRETVFEVGYTSERTGGGSGFGLAIVQRIADAHGWSVNVAESEAGGARFTFEGVTVPVSRPRRS